MVGGPQVRFHWIAASFLYRNISSILLLALAFAATVAIGSALAARFVARGIERVARRALAIDPSAPQGLISLSEVPYELKPLVEALNRAFAEIDAYIRMQRRFLGNAAHQLRTPLTLLRAKIEDVAEPALKVELVRDVRRLTSLVSAMLDLARLQTMRSRSGRSISPRSRWTCWPISVPRRWTPASSLHWSAPTKAQCWCRAWTPPSAARSPISSATRWSMPVAPDVSS